MTAASVKRNQSVRGSQLKRVFGPEVVAAATMVLIMVTAEAQAVTGRRRMPRMVAITSLRSPLM